MILKGRFVKQDGNNPWKVTDEEYTFSLKQIYGDILLAGENGAIEAIRVETPMTRETGEIVYVADNTIVQIW